MSNIFNNIFAPKISKETNNKSQSNQAKSNDVKKNVANLFAIKNSVKKESSKQTSEHVLLMEQINKLNEKIIANNSEIEQKNKLNEKLANENKFLKANLQAIMRHYNLRFN